MFKMSIFKHIVTIQVLFYGMRCFAQSELLKDLPTDVAGDFLSILINGTVSVIGNCDGANNDAPATNYWIYTKDNPNNPSVVFEPTEDTCDNSSKIIFLAHGWSWDANAPYIISIKNAYLRKLDDVCIISVNWGEYAKRNYFSAYCTVPGVANNIANFICDLKYKLNVHPKTLHLVGHSMGAQVFGNAGNSVQEKCSFKVGRISALDPAGPLFNGITSKNRLDASDAIFVDVIHTNQGEYGYLGSCGHLDAYPNCGYFQPGCLEQVVKKTKNITDILNLPLDLISCNHRRSCDYFEESINSDRFVGQPCLLCGLPLCTNTLLKSEQKVMGENCVAPGSVRNYVFDTNATPPYAKG